MINAGNPSAANLQMRKYVKEHKQSSAQIFEKLNRRGRLNPAQNAMSAQLTNEQLLRFYVKETVPKLQYNNDDIQGQGGDTNSVLMSEIQRLIDVGNFNAEEAKGNMNNIQTNLINNANVRQTNLIAELQKGFTSVNDGFADSLSYVKTAIDDIADNLAIYASTNDASSQNIITSLNDLNTNLEQYNTTGTVSQGALFASLANLQTALANSNTNNAANTAAIDNLSIIMGSMGAVPGVSVPTTTPAAAPAAAPATAPASSVPAFTIAPPAPASAPLLAPPPSTSVLTPPPSTSVLTPIPALAPPPSASTSITAPPSLLGAIGGLGGTSTTTTDPATGITTTNIVVSPIAPTSQQQVDAAVTAAADVKGAGGSVMVTGPKMAIGVGNFPEYNAIKAKNGGAELTMRDYREILKQVATDLPKLFTEDLEKAKTATGKIPKFETYVNNFNKADLIAYSEKILIQKYKLDDATRKLQEVSVRSVLSREYGNAKIATYELQAVMRRGTPANKYQDLLNATIHQEKQISSATRVQTQFRSHLARQEFERQRLIGPSLFAQPELYSLVPGTGPLTESNLYDPSAPFNQAEFDAFFGI